MALKLIHVVFGSQSNKDIEDEIRLIYNSLSPEDRSIMDFVRDSRVNAALVVKAGNIGQYFGPQAMKFLRSYGNVAASVVQADYRSAPKQEFPPVEVSDQDNHLSKTRSAPEVQYSERGRTTGQHYQYVAPQYLQEENMGMYERNRPYPLVSHYPTAAYRDMQPDDRTRLPYHR